MGRKLTQQQEGFCLDVLNEVPAGKAYLAHYKCKPSAADALASRLVRNAKIEARLQELRKKAEDAAISTVKERQKILTQIQRATIADFVNEYGNLDIDEKAKLQTAAVSELKTERTPLGERTILKLRDPVGAIAEHNKMDKIYSDQPQVNIDNRQVNFIVKSQDEADEVERLLSGIPKRLNGHQTY